MKLKMFQTIKKIVYEERHNQPYGTDDVVSIYKIKVPYVFRTSSPSERKVTKAIELYIKKGHVDKPISVKKVRNRNGKIKYILRDEYTRYLALKNNGIKKIPVKIVLDETK